MTITLPDTPATLAMSEAEIRLELACALFAQGRIGKVGGAEMAGVDFITFQRALGERGIPLYTAEMLEEDLVTMRKLWPEPRDRRR